MFPNIDYHDLPHAAQRMMARSQTNKAAALPRRSFLKLASAGGLALGAFPHLVMAQATGQAASALKPTEQPSAFVQIASNGEVTVTINRLEFGQGVQTALPMILAEELDADWSLVRSRHGSNDGAYIDPRFGIHITGGSNSIKNSFMQYRELGARARSMLLGAAAARWKVDAATLRTQSSTVLAPDGRKLDYGELAEAAMALPVPEKVSLKDPSEFRIIGRPTSRLDARAKSSGQQNFGIDVRLSRQLTAVVARPPVFGARLASVDDSAARAVKGVKAVLRVPLDGGAEGVAIVADGYWQATQGRDALKLQWDTSAVEKVDSEKQLAQYRELAARPGPRKFDADMAPLGIAPRQLEAEFVFPYLAHAAMEPLNCTVQLSEGRAEVWTGSQCPGLDGAAVARVLGLKPEQVAVHVQMAGGGFGRRFAASSDFVVEACEIAKAARAAGLNAPVRTLWSREDDMRGGYYRPMHLHRALIGFDERGKVLAWDHVIVGQSITTGTVFGGFQVKDGIDATATEGIVDLHERGALPSLLAVNPAALQTAIALGEEWLGPDSAILKCLRLGVALHHGALPTAYRKEVERLLRDGVLKVTISSPTLAQGLNLSATAVVMHSLYRNGEMIKVSEFKNVIGRAGRAYIDVEGLVLFPIFEDRRSKKHNEWVQLIGDPGAREMESGLIQLLMALLLRMHKIVGGDLNQLTEYVVNNAAAWNFPDVPGEKPKDRDDARKRWETNLATLDTAILSLIGEENVPDADIEATLDAILQSSLWQRRLLRTSNEARVAFKSTLLTRSRYIWANSTPVRRKGYFLAGLGLAAGQALDAVAAEANELLVEANAALLLGDSDTAITAITGIAVRVFPFHPFSPDPLPGNWRDILRLWLLGQPLAALVADGDGDGLRFIEDGLVYRLPWAMEALRVRASANGDVVGGLGAVAALEDYELGLALSAVETGTMNRSASILMQAGFNSRLAAIKAVNDTGATFDSGQALRNWLRSPEVAAVAAQPNWPTPETRSLWLEFAQEFAPRADRTWAERTYLANVNWTTAPPPPGSPVCLHHWNGQPLVLSPEGLSHGLLPYALNEARRGLLRATVAAQGGQLDLLYLGPDDLWNA